MNMSEERKWDWWDDRVEAFVDGALEEGEDREIRETLPVHKLLADEIFVAQTIRDGFRAMSETTCPEVVSRDIRRAIAAAARAEKFASWREMIAPSLSGYRRYAVIGVVVMVVVFGVLNIQREQALREPAITQALEDVKWTLALVSGVSSDAAGVVRTDVFEPLVQDNIGRTLDVLVGTKN